VDNFTLAALTPEKQCLVPIVCPRAGLDTVEKKKIEARFVGPPALSQVAIPTELFQLQSLVKQNIAIMETNFYTGFDLGVGVNFYSLVSTRTLQFNYEKYLTWISSILTLLLRQ
jgi:hypothetical protein